MDDPYNRSVVVTPFGTVDPFAATDKDVTLTAYGRLFAAGREGSLGSSVDAPSEPYQQALWIYRCVSEIQRTVKGIPLVLARDDAAAMGRPKSKALARRRSRGIRPLRGCKSVAVGKAADGELVESGPAVELFDRPNGYQDWPAFVESTAGWLLLEGRCAWVLTDLSGDRPREMHVVRGGRIKPVMEQDANGMPSLSGYLYTAPRTGRRIPLTPDEVKYFCLWSPSDSPLDGMAPAVPARLATATDYNASLFNASLLKNGAVAGLAVSFPGELSPEQREEYSAALAQRHAGAANAAKSLILEGGATAQDMAQSMRDLQWHEGKRVTRLEICAAYGVPPVVAGWVEAAGDSSAYTSNALRQFYQQTVFPFLDGFTAAIEEIARRFDAGIVAWWNVEDQPIVQEMRRERIDSAAKLFGMGRPFADINDMLDLGLPERPGDDVGFLPAGLSTVQDVIEGANIPTVDEPLDDLLGGLGGLGGGGDAPPPAPTPPAAPGGDDADAGGLGDGDETDAPKGHLRPVNGRSPSRYEAVERGLAQAWRTWIKSWEPLARQVGRIISSRLVVQMRKVQAELKRNADQLPSAGDKAQAKDAGVIARILLRVFKDAKDQRTWRAKVESFVRDSQELGLRQALKEAGYEGDKLDEALRTLLANPAITRAAAERALVISTTIDDRTREILRRNLASGIEEGETVKQLADRVQDVMANRRRAAVGIARNHVGAVLSKARHEGQQSSGMTHKLWVFSRGAGQRRPGHMDAERRYASHPCPIDQPFLIGGERLMYPRDESASAKETANCQCVQVARRIRERKGAVTIADFAPAIRALMTTAAWDDVLRSRTNNSHRGTEA
ncbi:MAG: Phage portal protein [Planctomycetes bacterium ADurb.Bin126]|nr:MAG: Phage portal protein [Planctomycetes bacterium ADurb.Bin126]HOD79964.1 phage portal protein [Phycisphaerae bacterium]HQL74021.1 phage portal protein [Phycisphaerae bacterium]